MLKSLLKNIIPMKHVSSTGSFLVDWSGARIVLFTLLAWLAPGLAERLAAAEPTTNVLVAISQDWRYDASGTNQGTAWRSASFDDLAWAHGPGLLGAETAPLPEPLLTPFPLPQIPTCYFRSHFNFTGDSGNTELRLKTIIDDGAVIYLNGTEVYRVRMPAGVITYNTLGNATVVDATYEGPVQLPTTALLTGDNVIAVEVHQSAPTSSDLVFGLTLDAVVTNGLPPAPPSVVTVSSNRTVVEGTPVTLSVVVAGTPPFTYQWFYEFSEIPGATNTTLDLGPVDFGDDGLYAVEVSSPYGFAYGEVGYLHVVPLPPEPETIFDFNSQLWRYSQEDSFLDRAWTLNEFNDSDWPEGQGLLGFETIPFVYPVPLLTTLSNVAGRVTYYFRTHFQFAGDPVQTLLQASIYIDDGAVFYLNGLEAGRVRMPAGPITPTSLATAPGPEGIVGTLAIPSTALVVGDNVLAVEVHQVTATSSDLILGLTLVANVTNILIVAPSIVDQPQSQTVELGSSATFSVLAAGDSPLLYQWRFNGSPLPGEQGSALNFPSVAMNNAGDYSVVVRNSSGSITSVVATLTVVPGLPPFGLAITPPSLVVAIGGSATFQVTASGTAPLAYQWLFTNSPLAGRTNPALDIASVSPTDAGSYRCVVSNPFGTATSSNAVLAVVTSPTNPPPLIFPPGPVVSNFNQGASTTLRVSALGTGPFRYQWYFNGPTQPIPGNDTNILFLPNLQPEQGGTYTVVVSNPFGSATNRGFVVNVVSPNVPAGIVSFTMNGLLTNVFVFAGTGTSNLVPAGSAILAQLLWGETPTTLQPVGAAADFNTPGRINGGPRRLPGITNGETVFLQVRAWEAAAGATYEQALTAGGRVGTSLIFPLGPLPTSGSGLPMFGLQSFALGIGEPPTNHPPTAFNQSVMLNEDESASITLAGQDPDGDNLSFGIPGQTLHGLLTASATGFIYTPQHNYSGPDTFTFVAFDGQFYSAPATVNLTVLPVNDPPEPIDQTITLDEDISILITLIAYDADGDALIFSPGAAAHGTLSGTSPSFLYTPSPNYNGPDAFSFVVGDGHGFPATGLVNITVRPVNDPPILVATVGPLYPGGFFGAYGTVLSTNGSNAVVIFDATLSSDPDGESFSILWVFRQTEDVFGLEPLVTNLVPVGSYIVGVYAYDGVNQPAADLYLQVLTPGDVVQGLIARLGDSGLPRKPTRPLVSALKRTAADFDRNRFKQGAQKLREFQRKVHAELGRLYPEQAQRYIADAQDLLDALGL